MAITFRPFPFHLPHLVLSTISFFFLKSLATTKPLCRIEDRNALLQFNRSLVLDKFTSGDPLAYPRVASWVDGDCCSWDGVECDKDSGHVVGLDLSSSSLYGSIDSGSSLFQLVHLQKLNLGNNNFNFSQIPSEIGMLSELTLLNLSASAFYGRVPSEITKLSNLAFLDLGQNRDEHDQGWLELKRSDFLSIVRTMSSLEKLDLSYVSISSNLPDLLGNLSSLTYLNLLMCNLFGSLPPSLGNLSKLRHLNLAKNNFSSSLPLSLGNLTKLTFLNLWDSKISGPIPSTIGDLTGLRFLVLQDNNFSGKIPSELANLTQLITLSLANNSFTPGDMSWVGNQIELKQLVLYDASLVGEIPYFIHNLTRLQELSLASNHLTGPIPPWITDLTQLVALDLGSNQLKGQIPNSMSRLVNIQKLYLGPNMLTGIVRFDMFAGLRNLTHLQIDGSNLLLLTEISSNASVLPNFQLLLLMDCNLSQFPSFLRYQDELYYLSLCGNKIQGQIPSWIGNITKLSFVDLSFNFLLGFEQSSIFSSLTKLRWLDLSHNKLQGTHPVLPPSILDYRARDNHLTGEISSSFCDLESLFFLDLSYNNLSGLIPPCLGNLNDSLLVMNLANNLFRGSIPVTFGNLSSLRFIDLSHNQLEGQLPRSLVDCQMLEVIDLSENQIAGHFPFWLGELPKLAVLILRFNQFFGEIGTFAATATFPKLRILDLSNNNLTGVVRDEFLQNLSSMKSFELSHFTYMAVNTTDLVEDVTYGSYYDAQIVLANRGMYIKYWKIPNVIAAIDLSSNKFQGDIPISIGTLKMVNVLNLSNNHFSGPIPSALGDLSRLESLDLSSNFLSGEIPGHLSQLNFMAFFNVSNNQLEGRIPQGGQFNTFQNSSYEGNLALCGKPLTKTCENSEAIPPPEATTKEHGGSGLSIGWEEILIGYGCGVVVGLAIGFRVSTNWFIKIYRLNLRQPKTRRQRGRTV